MFKTSTLSGGKSKSVDYHASKPTNVAPVIIESFVDDEGEMQHILESGNTISEKNYTIHWVVKKTAILPKNHKGEHIGNVQSK